jgi:hypothetical protein
MPVLAIFKYTVKPGRMADFMAKLKAAADPKFNSSAMPHTVRLFRSSVSGPDTSGAVLTLNTSTW